MPQSLYALIVQQLVEDFGISRSARLERWCATTWRNPPSERVSAAKGENGGAGSENSLY